MENIVTYIREYGEYTFTEEPLNEVDSLVLCQLSYLNYSSFVPGLDKRNAPVSIRSIYHHPDRDVILDDYWYRENNRELFAAAAQSRRFGSLKMNYYVNVINVSDETQFAAITYVLDDKNTYIAYRGTDATIIGWKEDLNMAFMTVPSQQEAVEYVRRAAQRNGDQLIFCGHSKGGNLSVYAGACADPSTRERIRRIYSFDGPGVDEETLHSCGYALVSGRIESYLPQSSVVGMLVHYHPVYTVVRALTVGILQHDVMTWQVKDGDFVRLGGVDMTCKITDEATHAWLATMDMDERRLLVDTLYQVVDAAQGELVTDLITDWRDSAARMLDAIRDLDSGVKQSVRKMLRSLFSTGADEVVRIIMQNIRNREWEREEQGE